MADVNDYLLGQFADEFDTSGGEGFLALLDEWQPKVEERTFSLNLVDVTVNFVGGWVEIADLFAANRTHRLPLAQLRAIAGSARKRGT